MLLAEPLSPFNINRPASVFAPITQYDHLMNQFGKLFQLYAFLPSHSMLKGHKEHYKTLACREYRLFGPLILVLGVKLGRRQLGHFSMAYQILLMPSEPT